MNPVEYEQSLSGRENSMVLLELNLVNGVLKMNKSLQAELLQMMQIDLDYRESLLKDGTLYEGYDEEMESIHLRNAEKLHHIVSEYGWPGISLVGRDGAKAAYIIAQHSISNPPLQRSFLASLSEAVAAGEASRIQEASLQDRVLYNEGNAQLYGMLFDWNEDGQLFSYVDDLDKANMRRKDLGLATTVQEATELHRKEIEEECGGPPKDIKKHHQMTFEWAVKVGWRS